MLVVMYTHFAGALVYADDIVLIVPTATVLRRYT